MTGCLVGTIVGAAAGFGLFFFVGSIIVGAQSC